jgi:hypothetical protein
LLNIDKIGHVAWRAVPNNECLTSHSCPAPLLLRTARRERAVRSVAPRNGAGRLLHRQGGATVECVSVDRKVAQMFAPSLVRIPKITSLSPKINIDKTRRVVSRTSRRPAPHGDQHGLHDQSVRPKYGNRTEPPAQQSGLKLGSFLARRDAVASHSQRQASIPGVPKNHAEGAVKGRLWARRGRSELNSTFMGT